MRLKNLKRATAMVALSSSVLLAASSAAMASTSPTFTNDYSMKYRVYGSTQFSINNDGYVTVDVQQYTGATTAYQINIGQVGGDFVGGTCSKTLSNNVVTTCSFKPGNSSKKYQVVLTKRDDGQYVTGGVVVR